MTTFRQEKEKILKTAYVEDCFVLKISHFGRGILRSEPDGKGKRGSFFLTNGTRMILINFHVEIETNPKKLVIEFSRGPEKPKYQQEILLTSHHQGLGQRPYFKIRGKKLSALYRRADGLMFGSRSNQRLRYRSANRKPSSALGILVHQLGRLEKLELANHQVKRIIYAGKMTRRAKAVVHLSAKWRLPEMIKA